MRDIHIARSLIHASYKALTLYTCTVELPIKDTPIKDTIEITSEQRTRFNVSNGDFPTVLIYS